MSLCDPKLVGGYGLPICSASYSGRENGDNKKTCKRRENHKNALQRTSEGREGGASIVSGVDLAHTLVENNQGSVESNLLQHFLGR